MCHLFPLGRLTAMFLFALLFTFSFHYPVSVMAQSYFSQNPGAPIYGKPLTEADLMGKVVYIEYWGINCGPCRAAFPHLVEAVTQFGRSGSFVMIGSHMQELTPEVPTYLQSVNCNFTNYQQYICPLAPPEGGGIPQAYLLNYRGELVGSGHPKVVLPLIPQYVEEAMRQNRLLYGFSPVTSMDIPSGFEKVATQFSPEKAWAAPIKQLQKRAKKDEEAQAFFTEIESAIDTEIQTLADQRREKPTETLLRLNRLKKNLKGLPQLEKVEKMSGKLEKVKGAPEMLKVWAIMEAFQKKAQSGKLTPASAERETKKIVKKLKEVSENDAFHDAIRDEATQLVEKIEGKTEEEEM
ncbi:MAG: hypothetical protein Q4C70_07475 [Planctomycetia bacterium]|nr:hypothetical protein [Planctomycetia bacterium]